MKRGNPRDLSCLRILRSVVSTARHPLALLFIAIIGTAFAMTELAQFANAQRQTSAKKQVTLPEGYRTDDKISPEAARQISALIKEKESRTPAQRKIDSQLIYKVRQLSGDALTSSVPALETGIDIGGDGRVEVDIRGTVDGVLLAKLNETGSSVLDSLPGYKTILARVPIEQIENIASLDEVIFIQPNYRANVWTSASEQTNDFPSGFWQSYSQFGLAPQKPIPTFAERAQNVRRFLQDQLAPSVGSQTSQGDTTHQANTVRSTIGTTGNGIKIGVLSNGVASLAASQALGDLGPVTVLPGQIGTGDEGTAMLEIVHDLAPGAELYFATANPIIPRFAQNIRDLRAAGCDIIIDDVFYFVETPFQDGQAPSVVSNTNGGVVTQAVNDVTAAGALFFSSAGNQGNVDDNTASCYQGDFVSAGPSTAPLPLTGTVHDFGAGAQFDLIATGSGNPINLYWADPLGGSANDYDLFVLNSAGATVVASSTNIQNGTQDPFEQTGTGNTTNNRVVVLKKTGSADRFFHITINANGVGRLGTSAPGTTKGHSMAANAFSVAATPALVPGPFPGIFSSSNVSEPFSSDGPRRIFFNAGGTAFTPGNSSSTGGILRQKPDFTAADRVSVTGVGGFPTTFSGTSAAAPHAGAIAALIKSGLPSATNTQIMSALISTAIDIETPGTDRDTGAGIIMPLPAMASLGITAQADIAKGNHTLAELPGFSDADGQLEPFERGTLSIAQLSNGGVATATGVTATLSSATPGVTVFHPGPFAYADIAPGSSQSNVSQYAFVLGAAYTCGTPINFVLTINYTDPTAKSKQLAFTVDPSGGFSVTKDLDGTLPPANPKYVATIGTQTNRVTRDGHASTCSLGKAVAPGVTAATNPRYDAYSFVATTTGCLVVSYSRNNGVAGSSQPFVTVYSGSFNPASVNANYLADSGSSAATGQTVSFSFNAVAGQTYVIVMAEVPGTAPNVNYTLSVTGPPTTVCNIAPTAAAVSLSGRVFNQSGMFLGHVTISLVDINGVTRSALTGSFGYYSFEGLASGQTYILSATAKGYTFAPRVVTLNDEVSGFDLIADQ